MTKYNLLLAGGSNSTIAVQADDVQVLTDGSLVFSIVKPWGVGGTITKPALILAPGLWCCVTEETMPMPLPQNGPAGT